MEKFPSIVDSFKETWETFKKALGGLFFVSLTSWVVTFLVTVIFVLVVVIGLATSGIKFSSQFDPKWLSSQSALILGLVLVVYIIFSVIWQTILSGALVAAIGNADEKLGVKALLSRGKAVFWPMFLSGILTFLLVFGSFMLLFFPAILVGFFVGFVMYEVVLGNKKAWQAVRGSVQIIGQNFGEVFVRMLVFWVVYIVYFMVISALQQVNPALGLIFFIPNLIIPWFALCYSVVLYKHAKERTDEHKKPSMGWIIALTIIGWLIFSLAMVGVAGLAMKNKDKIMQSIINNQKKTEVTEDMRPEVKVHWDRSQELFKEMKGVTGSDTKAIQAKVIALNDENIAELKKAIELDPENARLWADLGSAYSWLSSKGTENDPYLAFKKATELEPDNVVYNNSLGDTLIALGKYDEAVLVLNKSIRMNEKTAYGHQSLGVAYERLKVYDQARLSYQKALEVFQEENNNGQFDQQILALQKAIARLK